MKKTMKKCLILALVVMTVITAAFCVSAAGNDHYCNVCGTYVPVTKGDTIKATCETEGYVEMICKPCSDEGTKTLLYKADIKPALGHVLEDVYNLAADKKTYQCDATCQRAGCDHYETLTDKVTNEIVKFYKVTYVNSFADATKAPYCKYADLAYIELDLDNDDTTKCFTEKEVYTEFVQEGNTASYMATPYRMPDRDHGKYRFVGWSFKAQAVRGETGKIYSGFGVPVEGMEGPEYKVYAVFEGEKKAHSVTFYGERGEKLVTLTVEHAKTVKDAYDGGKVPTAPLKADNIEYKYTFAYWRLMDEDIRFSVIEGVKLSDGSELPLDAVYGDIKLKPQYTEDPKVYMLKYFDRHGNALGNEVIDDVTVVGTPNTPLKKPDTAFDIYSNPAKFGLEASYFDAAYDYNFTGNWLIEGRENAVVDINNVRFSEDILDYDQTKGYIKVTPQYVKVARIYDLEVFVTYPDDGNWHSEEAIDLQVTDADGNPIGVATLTKNDIISRNDRNIPTFRKVFKVKYSPKYRVAATAKNYKGESTPVFMSGGTDYNKYQVGGSAIVMKHDEGEPCSCICHGIFKPVWVGILNILYNLFKAEYVCCDDMFANIGDNLAYGPNKT